MAMYLQEDEGSERAKPNGEKSAEGDVYELTGILRHLGNSAYRGHYEAQVLNPRLVYLLGSLDFGEGR